MNAHASWGWDISALFYAHTYGPLAHELDNAVFRYLGQDEGTEKCLEGAVVADCGCGPGVVVKKLAAQGASRVFAIDVSQKMLEQVIATAEVETVLASVTPELLVDLALGVRPTGFDLILFKRSLYQPRPEALRILETAFSLLRPGGKIVIVHPEGDWKRYAFGTPARVRRHTPYHLFNRAVSLGAVLVGAEDYAVYTRAELLALAEEAVGADSVELIPTNQNAFNLVAIQRKE